MISSWVVRKRSIVATCASITSASSSSSGAPRTWTRPAAGTTGEGADDRRTSADGGCAIRHDGAAPRLRSTRAGRDGANPLERVVGQAQHRPSRAERDRRPGTRRWRVAGLDPPTRPGAPCDARRGTRGRAPRRGRRASPTRWFSCVDARPPLEVGGNGAVRTTAEDVVDEAGHVPARAGLDEDPRALVVQLLDRAPELDRTRPVLDEQLADRRRRRTGRATRSCTSRAPSSPGRSATSAKTSRSSSANAREQRRVDGAVVGQLAVDQPVAAGDLARPLDRRRALRRARPGAGSCPSRRTARRRPRARSPRPARARRRRVSSTARGRSSRDSASA